MVNRKFFLEKLPRNLKLISKIGGRAGRCLNQARGFSQNKFHNEDLFTHLVNAYDIALCYTNDPLFSIAALFHDIGKIPTRRWDENKQDYTFHKHEYVGSILVKHWMTSWKFTGQEIYRVVNAIRHHQYRIYKETKDNTIQEWLQSIGHQCWQDVRILRLVDRMANEANVSKPVIYRLFEETDKRIGEIASKVFIDII